MVIRLKCTIPTIFLRKTTKTYTTHREDKQIIIMNTKIRTKKGKNKPVSDGSAPHRANSNTTARQCVTNHHPLEQGFASKEVDSRPRYVYNNVC